MIDTRNRYYSSGSRGSLRGLRLLNLLKAYSGSGCVRYACGALCFVRSVEGRNEAPERRFKVREKTCCSLLHNRHPVTFSSTARHSMQAKNKPLSALFLSRALGALLGGAVQPSKPFLSSATRPGETRFTFRRPAPAAAACIAPHRCICMCSGAHTPPPLAHEHTITPAVDAGVVAAMK
jgi:hypothetical protein